MRRFRGALSSAFVLLAVASNATADDREVAAIVGKAARALGGDDKLSKIQGVTWRYTGWMNMLWQGPEHVRCNGQLTVAALDRLKSEQTILGFGSYENRIRSVLNGVSAWLSWGDGPLKPTRHAAALKRSLYFAMIPVTLAPLRDARFKVELGGEERVGNTPAVVLNVTCSDGETIKVSFDKESGLPIKAVGKATLIDDPDMDLDVTQEWIYSNYKDFGGIKTASRIDFKSQGFNRRLEVVEFKILERVDPKLFSSP
jgi:hypothetical protein